MLMTSSLWPCESSEIALATAQQYLMPQTMVSLGVKDERVELTLDALSFLIRDYARLAGVRELRKLLEEIAHQIAPSLVREAVADRRRTFVSLDTLRMFVMHDSLRPFAEHTLLGRSRTPLVTMAAVVVLFQCFLKQEYLSWTSMIAVLVNVCLIVVLFIEFGRKTSSQELPEDVCFLGIGRGTVSLLALLAQCIII